MNRRTLLTLALLAAPAIVMAQQPSALQGQAPADTSKGKVAKKTMAKKHAAKKHAAKPAAKDTAKTTTP